MASASPSPSQQFRLYTPAQRARRDATIWTLVQGILAPLQFAVFLISLALVIRYLMSGEGYGIATASIIAKTGLLFLIMITGAIWEKAVFGQWLFAPAFFWEDVFSFVVISLHSLYLYGLLTATISPDALIIIVLLAYATYVINAGQFLWKLRVARLQSEVMA
ncbi:MAG: 2-vinyl bacteriochlorophyllide hydratase [Sulfitobacter sp.]